MQKYEAKTEWTKAFTGARMAYPAEYVIRIFKGRYPNLSLPDEPFEGKTLGDIGCGDGRNLAFLASCGFAVSGMEITQEICDKTKANLAAAGVEDADIRVGTNDSIPFADKSFDYLLSWNACYYMGKLRGFDRYVEEFARVAKPSARFILSIPKASCFIYKGAEDIGDGFCVIRNDPFKLRNGEVLRRFSGVEEIEETFSSHFQDFTAASVHDDCFGFDYHWHVVVCRRK